MSAPIAAASAEHYAWGAACDGWHLVRAPGLSVIQERMPPGTRELRHRHAQARQFFYVLAGEINVEVDGRVHALGVRVGVEVAPGAAHEVWNEGAGPAEFLVISQPASHGDRELAPTRAR